MRYTMFPNDDYISLFSIKTDFGEDVAQCFLADAKRRGWPEVLRHGQPCWDRMWFDKWLGGDECEIASNSTEAAIDEIMEKWRAGDEGTFKTTVAKARQPGFFSSMAAMNRAFNEFPARAVEDAVWGKSPHAIWVNGPYFVPDHINVKAKAISDALKRNVYLNRETINLGNVWLVGLSPTPLFARGGPYGVVTPTDAVWFDEQDRQHYEPWSIPAAIGRLRKAATEKSSG